MKKARMLLAILLLFAGGCAAILPRPATKPTLEVLASVLAYEAARNTHTEGVLVLDATERDWFPEREETFDGEEMVEVADFPTLRLRQGRISLGGISLPQKYRYFSEREFDRLWLDRRERLSFMNGPDVSILSFEAPHFSADGEKALIRVTWRNSWNDCGTSGVLLAERTGEQWRVVSPVGAFILW